MFMCKLDETGCTDDPCMYSVNAEKCPNRYYKAPKERTSSGQLDGLVSCNVEAEIAVLKRVLIYGNATDTHINICTRLRELGLKSPQLRQ